MNDTAQRVSATSLATAATALERGALSLSASRSQLGRLVASHEVAALDTLLQTLRDRSMDSVQAATTLRLLADAHAAAEAAPRPQLVWSDLDLRGSRDTAIVAQELFREARRSVLVSTYNLGHRPRDEAPPGHPVLRPLAERMAAQPGLRVRLFFNLPRKAWQADASAERLVEDFARWFLRDLWPWPPRPELYFDPRSLADGEATACLHAKCIVVDDERALVTSANLTEAAQTRNIEAGVLLTDPSFAKSLRLQFEALINRKLVQRIQLEQG